METTRRTMLQAAATTAVGFAAPSILRAQSTPDLTWATFTPGFLPAFMQHTLDKGFDRKNGLTIKPPAPYSSLTTYYGDFVAGAFDMCFGSWDTFAVRAIAGVPVRFLCGINPGDLLNLVTLSDKIKSVQDLRGKVVAAPTSSGTFRLMKGLIHAFYGVDLEKETTIQTVDHPLAGVTLVLADRADAAVTWEPSVAIGMMKNPQLRVLLNIGDAYRTFEKHEMPFLGIAIREDALKRNPGVGAKLRAAFADTVESLNADPAAAYRAAEKATGLSTDVLMRATESKRLKYRFASMADPTERRAVVRSSELLTAEKDLPKPVADTFFVD